jgi:Flp pilus assembly protein TadD
VRHHEFLNFDDNDYVTENRHVQAGWTMENLAWAFSSSLHHHWHPLTWLSHMTDCQFFGLNPGWHHLSSVFFHMANTLLLFLVFRRLTGAPLRSAFVAALFALHPLHVEPVAWVADRKDVLSAFFWMLAMLAYVRYAERPAFMRYIVVIIAFILGLMAKPMVVTLPFVLLLLDYWPLERFEFGQPRRERPREKRKGLDARYQSRPVLRLAWEKGLFFLIVGASAVVTILVMHHESVLTLKLSRLWPTGGLMADTLINYVAYIAKTVWPLKLAVPYPEADLLPVWQIVGAFLLLSGISSLVIWQRRERPYLLVGWLWYLITLLPVIGLVKAGPHQMADRYVYIPLVGLFVMVAWGVPDLVKGWRHRRLVLGISASTLLLGCMAGAWLQARHWKNSISLFGHSVTVTSNNQVAHNNLGVAHADQGDFDAAIAHCREAIRINSNYGQAHFNLGVAFAGKRDFQAAIRHYSEAIRIAPHRSRAYQNLGVAMANEGRLREAMGYFSEAIRIKPEFAEAHCNLGRALALQGSFQEAIGHFSEAIRIKPDFAEAHHDLGVAMAKEGRLEEAIGHFSEAIRIKPDFAEARHKLDFTLRLVGKSRPGSDSVLRPQG